MKTSILSDAHTDQDALGVRLKPKPPTKLSYTPGIWDRFPSKLASVDEAPEPLRSAMREKLSPKVSIQLLIFGPANRHSRKRSSATLLAVTDNGWLLASDAEDGHTTVTQCDFANTLLLEQTDILLHGRLKIDFAVEGRAQFVTAEFNTVMEEYYQEAVHLLLDGMDDIPAIARSDVKETSACGESLPMKFHNALVHFEPSGQRLLDFVYWPAVIQGKCRWLKRESAPEALLALSDRELIFISEEKAWSWFRAKQTTKYGNIVTYCPLSRLVNCELSEHGLLDTVDLEARAPQGGEKLKIDFPREQKGKIDNFIKRVMERRATAAARLGGFTQPLTDMDTTGGRIE